MNQWRSPTAEKIYADRPGVNTRSCGTSHRAKKRVKPDDLKWADVICVMEQKHAKRLLSQFPGELKYKEMHILDIPDLYKFMDPELVEEITGAVDPLLTRDRDH